MTRSGAEKREPRCQSRLDRPLTRTAAWLAMAMLLPCVAFPQDAPARLPSGEAIQDLTSESLTVDKLVEALALPESAEPAPGKTRGGHRGIGSRRTLDCKDLRPEPTRGIRARATRTVAIEVLFALGSDALTLAAQDQLDVLGRALGTPELRSCCIAIEGHADWTGSETYNLDLSRRRAARVVDHLAEGHDVASDRLWSVGYGETRPIADNRTEDGRRRNRRVQVVNLGCVAKPVS